MFTGMPDFNQSVEMMKNMWSTAAKGGSDGSSPSFGLPGMSQLNPFGIPMVDLEELDKRIKDLKSVEAWLSLNLNVLQTTIQGLEVQKATLSALQGIADTIRTSASPDATDTSKTTATASDLNGASGKLAQDLMAQMSKSMTNMMSAFPNAMAPKSTPAKKTPAKKTPAKTSAAKTSKPRVSRSRA